MVPLLLALSHPLPVPFGTCCPENSNPEEQPLLHLISLLKITGQSNLGLYSGAQSSLFGSYVFEVQYSDRFLFPPSPYKEFKS